MASVRNIREGWVERPKSQTQSTETQAFDDRLEPDDSVASVATPEREGRPMAYEGSHLVELTQGQMERVQKAPAEPSGTAPTFRVADLTRGLTS